MNELLPDAASTNATEADRIRKLYLFHEASCQQLCWIYYLQSAFCALMLFMLSLRYVETGGPQIPLEQLGLMFLAGILGGVFFYLGQGLRKLDPSARDPVATIAGLNILSLLPQFFISPLAVLVSLVTLVPVNAYILHLMLSEKGVVVFSSRYAEIRRQTPHIQHRTPLTVVVAATALLFIVGIVTATMIIRTIN